VTGRRGAMARDLALTRHEQPQSSIAARTRSVASPGVAFHSNGMEISTSGYDVIRTANLRRSGVAMIQPSKRLLRCRPAATTAASSSGLRSRGMVSESKINDGHEATILAFRGAQSSPRRSCPRRPPAGASPSARRRSRRRTNERPGAGNGRRASGDAKRVMPPDPAPEADARRNRATGVQAARRHPASGRAPTLPGSRALENSAPSAGGPRADHARAAFRPPHIPHPRAGGRCDGRLARERVGGIGLHEARYATRPRQLRPSGSYPPRTCTAGVQAARRRPGDVAPRLRSFWVKDVLSRIAAHPMTRLAELLPHNWTPVQA